MPSIVLSGGRWSKRSWGRAHSLRLCQGRPPHQPVQPGGHPASLDLLAEALIVRWRLGRRRRIGGGGIGGGVWRRRGEGLLMLLLRAVVVAYKGGEEQEGKEG